MNQLVKKNILGIDVTDTSEEKILEYIFSSLEENADPYYIVTPNPEMVMRSRKDQEFKAVLNNAEISLCDGVGLYLAGKILGKPFKQRITGVDLLEKICKESVRKPVSIGFLGGKGSVAEEAVECLQKKYGKLNIVFAGDEWSEDKAGDKVKIPIDILFIALGFPKQERWMADHRDKGIYKVAMGVGGAFDYLSGSVPRAPHFMRAIGLEWLYRLIRQPWRWNRQLALVSFMVLVFSNWITRDRYVKPIV